MNAAALAVLLTAVLGVSSMACSQTPSISAATPADRLPPTGGPGPATLARQLAEYEAESNKTIVELQPFRETASVAIQDGSGRQGTATLIDLNPRVNAWFLLRLHWSESDRSEDFHLENIRPRAQTLVLTSGGDLEVSAQGKAIACGLWSDREPGVLRRARESGLPYAPLCGERLYLRNQVAGTFTLIERVTDVLRDHVWGGDQIVTFVREHAFRDAFAETCRAGAEVREPEALASMPRSAQVRDADLGTCLDPPDLGIDVKSAPAELQLGGWYAVNHTPGVFLSLMRPSAVSERILESYRNRVNSLDAAEAEALDYLVAMDLSQFDLHYALGTDHPRVGWSERILPQERDPHLSGPDGIGSVAPVVVDGMVSPADINTTVAAFAAGFKREHGAFRYGVLAEQNHGSHYGFMQRGATFSKLQPGLATLYVRIGGFVDMKTWTAADQSQQGDIEDARQNGVALIDIDPQTQQSAPGALVNQWGPGNWSGSESEQLRTLRAGACLQESAAGRFLIFGYFSTATPSAMARVFQAYGCKYAMLLDMNALEHTYFALYVYEQGRFTVEHLVQGMAVVDRKGNERLAPRFLGFPDDRDFFYLTRREGLP
jgi:hypothetical protein